jgi:hypothetical protein
VREFVPHQGEQFPSIKPFENGAIEYKVDFARNKAERGVHRAVSGLVQGHRGTNAQLVHGGMACLEPGGMGLWLKPVGLPQHCLAHFVSLLLAHIGGLRPLPDVRFRFLKVGDQIPMVLERLQVEVPKPLFPFHASFSPVICPPH